MRLSIKKLKNAGVLVHVEEDSIHFRVDHQSTKLLRLVSALSDEMQLNDCAVDEFQSVVHRFSVLQAIKLAS